MRSEFQFLQSEEDEKEFVEAFAAQAEKVEKESRFQWFFRVGDCQIQLLRSDRAPDQISIGRISIATHGFGLAFASAGAAEALYRKMRTWLKQRYVNRLTAENINNPASVTAYRTMWLGPDAQKKYRSGQVMLRSIFSGQVIIKEQPSPPPSPASGRR